MLTRLISLLFIFTSFYLSAVPTLVQNANGYTYGENGQFIQFSTLVFENGKVLAIGDQRLSAEYPTSQTIDVQGQTLLPGIIDAHGHLLGLGQNLLQVDLRGITSAQEAAQKVSRYAKQNQSKAWIIGRGWNQELWKDKQFPTASMLDEYETQRPIVLERIDSHATWLNSKALALAGIDKSTVSPPGGTIVKDQFGNPTGVLIDNASRLIEAIIPADTDAQLEEALAAASDHLISQGITSAHDAGISFQTYSLYQRLANEQKLSFRIYAMIAATDPQLGQMLANGYINDKRDFLSIRSVKAYGDGALGSRGAALLAHYEDDEDNLGLLVTKQAQLKPLFDDVIKHKFQLNFHAIGDRANRLALDQFEDSLQRLGGTSLRHRIEHAQIIHPDDIPRFKTIGIIPSMQPTHATSDKAMAPDRLGEARLEGAYAWRTFLEQGSIIAAGSDFPVELANPFFGIHAAVTRQDRENHPAEGWLPNQKMTVYEAFKAFTLDAAYAAHQESILGGLTPGKWADFILVDRDIFTIPAEALWKTQVEQTWIAGKKVYQR